MRFYVGLFIYFWVCVKCHDSTEDIIEWDNKNIQYEISQEVKCHLLFI